VQLIRGDRLRVSAVIDKQGEGFARRLDFEHFRKAFALCDAEVYILDMSFVKVREEEVVNFLNDEANKQRIRNLRELKGIYITYSLIKWTMLLTHRVTRKCCPQDQNLAIIPEGDGPRRSRSAASAMAKAERGASAGLRQQQQRWPL
jgi:hypothetical protein